MVIKSTLLMYRFWIIDFFHKSPIRSQYNEICQIQENKQKSDLLRNEHLYDLLNFATKNIKLYEKCDAKSLSSFPVVNKSILREHYDAFYVSESKNPFQNEEKYHIQKITPTPILKRNVVV